MKHLVHVTSPHEGYHNDKKNVNEMVNIPPSLRSWDLVQKRNDKLPYGQDSYCQASQCEANATQKMSGNVRKRELAS